MPETGRRNVLVGLFVLGGLVCMGILIVKFGEAQSWFGKRYQIHAKFDQIIGVREGTEVQLAGVWIGNVKKVDLMDRNDPYKGIDVVMEVDRRFDVPEGAVANVMVQLMGQAMINIMPQQPPQPALPRNGSGMIVGTITGPLDQVLPKELQDRILNTSDQIRVLAKSLTPVADDLHELLRQRTIEQAATSSAPTTQEVTENLYTLVERLNNVAKHFDAVVGDPQTQSNLKETVANLRTSSEDARVAMADVRKFGESLQQTNAKAQQVLGNLNETIDTARQRVDSLGRKLEQNSDELSRVLGYFASAGRDLAEGQGTLGLFLRDPKFYEELFLTVERLAAAAQDLQVTVRQWRDAGFPVKLK